MADGDAALLALSILDLVHPFTVEDYHRMAEAGILSADERTELIEGVVVTMAAVGSSHFVAVLRLEKLLRDAAGARALVSVQGPVQVPPRSEPQPDAASLCPPVERYEAALPGPSDVFLLAEVSNSTLARDRDVKGPLYARHGIPEYWLVGLDAQQVLVHRDPLPAERRWGFVQPFGADAVLDVAALPGATVPLAGLFGAGPPG